MSEFVHISKVIFDLFGKDYAVKNGFIGRATMLKIHRYQQQAQEDRKYLDRAKSNAYEADALARLK